MTDQIQMTWEAGANYCLMVEVTKHFKLQSRSDYKQHQEEETDLRSLFKSPVLWLV